jgi:hypothetical protein
MPAGRAAHEAQAVHRGADHRRVERGGGELDLEVAEVRRLRHLEDENGRLKRLVADLTLDNQALKGLLAKHF